MSVLNAKFDQLIDLEESPSGINKTFKRLVN